MRIGSICSGAGALDLAVEAVFGGETIWHAEIDAAASTVLEHRFPGTPNHGDITQVDWRRVDWVEVVCAGFPCQDVSAAGRRAGLKHGTRTGVFANVMNAVETLRPRYVVLENVLGLLTADGDEWPDSVHELNAEAERWGRIVDLIAAKKAKAQRKGHRDREWWHRKEAEGIRASRRHKRALAQFRRERARLVPRAVATVLGSLAQAGYDAQWRCLRASDVGAPHQRERIFILATAPDAECGRRVTERVSAAESGGAGLGSAAGTPDGSATPATDAGDDRRGRGAELDPQEPLASRRDDADRRDVGAGEGNRPDTGTDAADAAGDRRHEGRPELARLERGSDAALGDPSDDRVELLPTPKVAAQRVSRKALTQRHWSAPGLEQALEIARGELPREYESWDEVQGRSGDDRMLPTPTANDNHGASHARVSWEAATRARGDGGASGLADVATLFAPGNDRLLPTPCAQHSGNTPEGHLEKKPGRKQVTDLAILAENDMFATGGELLPTPRASRGASTTETAYALGGERTDDDRPQGEVLLPTPTCQDGANTAGPSQFDRNSLPLNVVATLLPTPGAADGNKGKGPRSPEALARKAVGGERLDRQKTLVDLPHLLATPSAADGGGGGRHSNHKERSAGGKHLTVPGEVLNIGEPLLDGIARDYTGTWGPYAAVVARWEQVAGPVPSPTQINRNGKPRLNPAFSEWMMGWPAGWVTDLADNGTITRNDALRIIGNGVVPQQAVAALTHLVQVATLAA